MAVPETITKEYADHVINNILRGIGLEVEDDPYLDDYIDYQVYVGPPEYYIGPVVDFTRFSVSLPLYIFDCTSPITFYIDNVDDDAADEISQNFISGEYASPIIFIMVTTMGEYLTFDFMGLYLFIDIPEGAVITLGNPALQMPLMDFTKQNNSVKLIAT